MSTEVPVPRCLCCECKHSRPRASEGCVACHGKDAKGTAVQAWIESWGSWVRRSEVRPILQETSRRWYLCPPASDRGCPGFEGKPNAKVPPHTPRSSA